MKNRIRSIVSRVPKWTAGLLACVLLASCACQLPPPSSKRAERDENMQDWIDLYAAKEPQRPANAQAVNRRLQNSMEGDPEEARRTARKILELD